MEQGIFNELQEKKLSQLVDDVVKVSGVLEIADGYVFKIMITYLDNKVLDKIPDDVQLMLQEIATAVLDGDAEKAKTLATDLIASVATIPGIDIESEKLLIKGIIEVIVSAVLNWVESLKEQPV